MLLRIEEFAVSHKQMWPYGAMVARLTPDQKVMCSNHIGVKKNLVFWPFGAGEMG